MRTIHAPLPDLARAERLPACKEALEAALWQVIDRAKAAGWSGTEATLASALVLADLADAEATPMLVKREAAGGR